MSKNVSLDEVEAYEAELRRAHAENRAPTLRNPHEVFAENQGNSDSHLEELSAAEQKKATAKLHKDRQDALRQDRKLKQVIRDNSNKLSTGGGQVLPYESPSEERFNPPKTKEEKDALEAKIHKDFDYNKNFDDSFSDNNIPNVDYDGHVTGDSVNRVFTRKDKTFSEEELVREDEKNAVPVPERFRQENPPQVLQVGVPEPEKSGYVEGYVQDDSKLVDPETEIYVTPPTPADVPHTAIKTPVPEHVIGDETGTTREVSRVAPQDVTNK